MRTLSNNIEKKFGLESIFDGFMFIAPEIKGDMALEQAEFQSLVSGEDMSIARKNKTAQSLTWNVPGILASISKTISQRGGNISHASVTTTDDR